MDNPVNVNLVEQEWKLLLPDNFPEGVKHTLEDEDVSDPFREVMPTLPGNEMEAM